MSIRFDTVLALNRRTDGQTESVTQYHILHALHADTR